MSFTRSKWIALVTQQVYNTFICTPPGYSKLNTSARKGWRFLRWYSAGQQVLQLWRWLHFFPLSPRISTWGSRCVVLDHDWCWSSCLASMQLLLPHRVATVVLRQSLSANCVRKNLGIDKFVDIAKIIDLNEVRNRRRSFRERYVAPIIREAARMWFQLGTGFEFPILCFASSIQHRATWEQWKELCDAEQRILGLKWSD